MWSLSIINYFSVKKNCSETTEKQKSTCFSRDCLEKFEKWVAILIFQQISANA